MKKKCATCKKEKELKLFSRCRSNKDGYKYTCKECDNRNGKEQRKKRNDSNDNFFNTFL